MKLLSTSLIQRRHMMMVQYMLKLHQIKQYVKFTLNWLNNIYVTLQTNDMTLDISSKQISMIQSHKEDSGNVSVWVTDQTGNRSLYRGQLYKPRFLAKRFSSFSMPSYTEENVTNTSNALVNGEYKSIRKAAIAFQIPSLTLRDRQKKSKPRTESHVSNNY